MKTREDFRPCALEAAAKCGLLDGDGSLVELDSLMIADYLVALEKAAAVKIPMTALTDGAFSSLDAVGQMLADVANRRAASGTR